MNKELLQGLSNEQIRGKLTRLDEPESVVQLITNSLEQTVFGQTEACRTLARRVVLFETGLSNPRRPLGVEFFLGPPGSGKTEMSHALAKHLFGDANSPQLKIIDCAEFWDTHTVARLIGAPPSYVGYGDPALITPEFLNNRNILVFDEVEKGATQLHKVLLSIMEDGRLRSRRRTEFGTQETELDFSKSIIILTSNVGGEEIEKAKRGGGKVGFRPENSPTRVEDVGRAALKERFRSMPEFTNRIDDIVVFNSLGPEHYERIFWKFLEEINADLAQQLKSPPFVATSTEFKAYILGKIDHNFGARDMRHVLDKELLERLADYMESYNLMGKPVVATYDGATVEFYTDDSEPFTDSEELTLDEIKARVKQLAERNKK